MLGPNSRQQKRQAGGRFKNGPFLACPKNLGHTDELMGHLARIASYCVGNGLATVGTTATIGCLIDDSATLCFVHGDLNRDNQFRN